MNTLIEESEKYLIHSYNRYPVAMDHGEDVYLVDTEGKKYLDFGAGIAVCALGYSDEEFKNALKAQIDKATHFSNYFYSEPLMQAAKCLAEATGMDKVFMANSGTEANEGALKLARKYAIMQGHEERHEVISMNKAFHGRSMGALSVTGTEKYRAPFAPLISGVHFADYNDLDSVKNYINDKTYAIIVEAVQGEGGIYPADKEFLQEIRDLCTEHDIMMICDEVQCGMGRTGKMFAYQQYGIRPDIVTMAKGIGNGIVVGAFAAKTDVAKALVPGDHGTTFGGNPLASAAVVAVNHIFKEKNIVYSYHKPFPYTKVSKLVKSGVIVSDNPMDYLLLYRNASEVYSDRVHACIPTLAFGNKARLFSNSPRIALFENAKIPNVRERLVSIEGLKEMQDKQIAFLASLLQ